MAVAGQLFTEIGAVAGTKDITVGPRVQLWGTRTSPWLSTLTYHPGMNNRPVGGHGYEMSYTIDMIGQSVYQNTLCNIPDDSHVHTLCCENLKYRLQ
jgi:hypothetical protein